MSYIQDSTLVDMIFIKQSNEERISVHMNGDKVDNIDISIPSFIKISAIERKLKHIMANFDNKTFKESMDYRLCTRNIKNIHVDVTTDNGVAQVLYDYSLLDKDKCLAQLNIFDGYEVCCIVKE